jgi:hypothetical protein
MSKNNSASSKKDKEAKATVDKTLKLLAKATKILSKIEKSIDKSAISNSVISVDLVNETKQTPKKKKIKKGK